MYKIILLFFCALFLLLQVAPAQAEETSSPTTEVASTSASGVPRPNYKRYRGNSRHKARRLGPLRRWKLRRKAMRKKKAAPATRRGVISVDPPKGTMKK